MSDIVDLDVFVGPPRKAKLVGKTYLFPRDIPAALYLQILELQQRDEDLDDLAVVRQLYDDILALLQVHQPDMTALPAAVSIPVLVQMVGTVYAQAAEQAEPDPTPAGSPGKSPSRKPRSRSSKSSAS